VEVVAEYDIAREQKNISHVEDKAEMNSNEESVNLLARYIDN